MGTFLYTIAALLILTWLIGFFGYQLGGMIHILLAVALIVIVIRIVSGSGSDSDPI